MSRLVSVLVGVVLMAGLNAEPLTVTSQYTTSEGTFELRVKITQVGTDAYGCQSTHCAYSVFRNGSSLDPTIVGGGMIIGCEYVKPEEVRIEPIGSGTDTVGWMLGVGGICGNTFSWRWSLIRPASFFVPELRTVQRKPDNGGGIRRTELPADLDTWPELNFLSGTGILVAGASQLNPEVMAAVAKRCTEDEARLLNMHGLPTTPREIDERIAQVRQARELRERLSDFELHWDATCE